MRLAARTDANQPEVVKALRKAGAVVWNIRDPVDLLVGFRGKWWAVELKDGKKPPSQRKLTERENKALTEAYHNGLPHCIATSFEEVWWAINR